ncbi:MAG: hypothetical protein ACOC38_04445 [Promethearchaeia archaeon]
MNEETKEGEPTNNEWRKRLGKVIFWLGILVVIAAIMAPFVVSVLAFAGMNVQLGPYQSLVGPVLIFGVVMVIIGIALALFPGFSEDGLWIMMTGPFGKAA